MLQRITRLKLRSARRHGAIGEEYDWIRECTLTLVQFDFDVDVVQSGSTRGHWYNKVSTGDAVLIPTLPELSTLLAIWCNYPVTIMQYTPFYQCLPPGSKQGQKYNNKLFSTNACLLGPSKARNTTTSSSSDHQHSLFGG